MLKVYIAGRLNDDAVDYIKNMHKMMVFAHKVKRMGFSIFVPCLDVLMGMKFGTYDYEDYFYSNLEWLRVADAVFVCPGWEDSKGTIAEIKEAKKNGIPVYFKLENLKVGMEVHGRAVHKR